jgi:hypothetical protein
MPEFDCLAARPVSVELTRMETRRNLGGRGKRLMRVDLILHQEEGLS